MDTPTKSFQSGASLSDLLTTLQNLVKAVNNVGQNYLNVQGLTSLANISVPTVVKASTGRVCTISVTTAGSATGLVYDGATLTATSKPIWVIPEAAKTDGEPYVVNIPTTAGILVVPGTGQTVTAGYS